MARSIRVALAVGALAAGAIALPCAVASAAPATDSGTQNDSAASAVEALAQQAHEQKPGSITQDVSVNIVYKNGKATATLLDNSTNPMPLVIGCNSSGFGASDTSYNNPKGQIQYPNLATLRSATQCNIVSVPFVGNTVEFRDANNQRVGLYAALDITTPVFGETDPKFSGQVVSS